MKQNSHFFFSGILLGVAIIYLLTKSQYLGFGDSIGFLLFAERGFDLATNATSHFLYTNFNHLALSLFPTQNPVAILVSISIIFSLFSILFIFKYIELISKDSKSALISSLFFAFGFTWWRQSVTVEVYTFYCFWIIAAMYFMAVDLMKEKKNHSLLVALLLGLGTLTHIQTILFYPVFGWYLLSVKNISKKFIFFSTATLLGVILPLFLLPLWLNNHELSAVFFDNQYQETVLSLNFTDLFKGTLRSLGYLIYNFHIFIPFIILGMIKTWKEHRKLFWFSFFAAGPIWGFAMRYNVSDNYVFFLIPYMVMIGLGSLGLKSFLAKVNQKLIPLFIAIAFGASPLIYWSTWQIAENIEPLASWARPKAYKGGLEYYFWPGQRNSKDPLQIAQDIYQGKIEPIDDFERYSVAIEYLQEKKQIPVKFP